MSTYNVLGMVIGAGNTIVNKTDNIPFLGSWHLSGRRKTANKKMKNIQQVVVNVIKINEDGVLVNESGKQWLL